MQLADAVILIIGPIAVLCLLALVFLEQQILSLDARVKALQRKVYGIDR